MSLKKLPTGRWQIRWRDETGKQRAANFRSKELAQDKLKALHRGEADDRAQCNESLESVVAEWKRDRYPSLAPTTRARYDCLLRLYFDRLLPVPIGKLTPQVIDEWIRWLKEDPNRFRKGAVRTSFKCELILLKAILAYYEDYRDDPGFTMPVKRRHFEACKLRNRQETRSKDLSEADFLVFCQRLEQDYGVGTAALATLQFYQAARVSEAVALRWEDVHFDHEEPRRSRISFRQHALYVRYKGGVDVIEPGLKNSEEGKESIRCSPRSTAC
jgi:integrase